MRQGENNTLFLLWHWGKKGFALTLFTSFGQVTKSSPSHVKNWIHLSCSAYAILPKTMSNRNYSGDIVKDAWMDQEFTFSGLLHFQQSFINNYSRLGWAAQNCSWIRSVV